MLIMTIPTNIELKKIVTENSYGENFVRIHVIPNSSKTEFVGIETKNNQKIVRIKINAPPEDNKANIELIKFMKKNKMRAEIVTGLKSKDKIIKVIKN